MSKIKKPNFYKLNLIDKLAKVKNKTSKTIKLALITDQ